MVSVGQIVCKIIVNVHAGKLGAKMPSTKMYEFFFALTGDSRQDLSLLSQPLKCCLNPFKARFPLRRVRVRA